MAFWLCSGGILVVFLWCTGRVLMVLWWRSGDIMVVIWWYSVGILLVCWWLRSVRSGVQERHTGKRWSGGGWKSGEGF